MKNIIFFKLKVEIDYLFLECSFFYLQFICSSLFLNVLHLLEMRVNLHLFERPFLMKTAEKAHLKNCIFLSSNKLYLDPYRRGNCQMYEALFDHDSWQTKKLFSFQHLAFLKLIQVKADVTPISKGLAQLFQDFWRFTFFSFYPSYNLAPISEFTVFLNCALNQLQTAKIYRQLFIFKDLNTQTEDSYQSSDIHRLLKRQKNQRR